MAYASNVADSPRNETNQAKKSGEIYDRTLARVTCRTLLVASLYVETSALLKCYVLEPESDECQSILDEHSHWITSRITITETLINLRKRLSTAEFAIASKLFQSDINVFDVVEFDAELSLRASDVAAGNNLATLDAIHLASALRVKGAQVAFLTYDRRLANSARKSGLRVLGM